MSYFIFGKNISGITGSIYKIAENDSDFNNLNIIDSEYKIIQDSQENFDSVKYGTKFISEYNGDTIVYADADVLFKDKNSLDIYISGFKKNIKTFLDTNPNHPLFSKWNTYFSQLSNLNTTTIEYPFNKSLEQYFKDLGQTSLNPLQLP
jgi:hypothetical protein